MSITGGISSAVSALLYNASRLGAVADNVANVDTAGYKPVEVEASSLVTPNRGRSGYAAGGVRGSVHHAVDMQGLLAASASTTDLALAGPGFFPVDTASDPGTVRFTRAGSFHPDRDGNLINSAGFRLLGHAIGAAGAPSGGLVPVNVASLAGQAQASTHVGIAANLPADAANGSQYKMSARVYDSLGNAVHLPVTFEKAATNRHTLTIDNPSSGGVASEAGSGGAAYAVNVLFDGNGQILGFDANQDGAVDTTTPPDVSVTNPGGFGGNDLSLRLDLGGLGQYAGGFVVGGITTDGARAGTASGVTVGRDGTVTALFDNGTRRAVYQVPVAGFDNPNGLETVTGNAYQPTTASGPARFESAGSGGAGWVQSAALEQSGVDLGTEMVRSIMADTAYGFATRLMVTGQEMSRTLMNIKA